MLDVGCREARALSAAPGSVPPPVPAEGLRAWEGVRKRVLLLQVRSDLDTGGQGQAFSAMASHTGSRAGAFSKTLQSPAL